MMRAVLSLEFIGEVYYAHRREKSRPDLVARYERLFGRDRSRPWVAKLISIDPEASFQREFMRAQIDYSRANSTGSRGVFLYYALPDGIYEINERKTWKKVARYFIRVKDAQIEEVAREEIVRWFSVQSESQ